MNSLVPHKRIDQPRLIDVVDGMRAFARKASGDIDVRRLSEKICQGINSGDYSSEILAVYYWVHQNIRYMKDPHDIELVKEPKQLLYTKVGDCDDIATLLAGMLMSIGNQCNFVLVAFNGESMPRHVFVAVKTPNGLVPLDPVANAMTANMMRDKTAIKFIPV